MSQFPRFLLGFAAVEWAIVTKAETIINLMRLIT